MVDLYDGEKILNATHEGQVRLTDEIVIPCAVLEDGTRVLTQTEFVKSIGRTGSVKRGEVYLPDRQTSVPVFLSANNLQPFITKDLIDSAKPIPFRTLRNLRGVGYRAEFLPEVCNVFLDAKDAKALRHSQLHIAERCRLLIRAYATVGIIALVDEATGYQAARARNALEQILAKYLSDHKLKWAKTFPDEFYVEMFKLRGWEYKDLGYRFRPGVVGKYTNDIVYDRLAPGVLEKLQQLNPKNENGYRSAKHHQWLTEDHGVPELKSHLSGVLALMKASSSWRNFMRLLARAYPKPGSQMELPFPDDNNEAIY
jgi:hypothetical protein